jgi:hypothetical protein
MTARRVVRMLDGPTGASCACEATQTDRRRELSLSLQVYSDYTRHKKLKVEQTSE